MRIHHYVALRAGWVKQCAGGWHVESGICAVGETEIPVLILFGS